MIAKMETTAMKLLVITIGAQGAGKSTILRQKGLSAYVIATDSIRLEIAAPVQVEDGSWQISQDHDKEMLTELRARIGRRLRRGVTTILDSTGMNDNVLEICYEQARYFEAQVRFLDLRAPLGVCMLNNLARDPLRRVPKDVLERTFEKCELFWPPTKFSAGWIEIGELRRIMAASGDYIPPRWGDNFPQDAKREGVA
jgi:predicted kinase